MQNEQIRAASIKTTENVQAIAQTLMAQNLSRLSLPEIAAVSALVGRMVPAGNVPGMILSGLARLAGRKPPPQTVSRDINLLFKGVEQALNTVVYGTFFAGPAAVIWGYQNLLKLAGTDPEESFPDGTWQFYVYYAMREDTARHANEIHGFDSQLAAANLMLSPADRISAWVMAAVTTLHDYPRLLRTEWRERVATTLLRDLTVNQPQADRYRRLYSAWERQRPYAAPDSSDYPAFRQAAFERFLAEHLRELPADLRQDWGRAIQQQRQTALPAYQRQMSILAALQPEAYGETPQPFAIQDAHIAVIHQGRYYLIPACQPNSTQPVTLNDVRTQIVTLLQYPSSKPPAHLAAFASVRRASLAALCERMNPAFRQSVGLLRFAPILINADQRPRHAPLAEIRQAERGIGDHALTIFDTGQTFVFDQSHIFFDGAWGAALAEIMTNQALGWARHLQSLPPAQPGPTRPYALDVRLDTTEWALVSQAPQVSAEVAAETDAITIRPLLMLRKQLKQRNDQIHLTVNDLLLLYRAIHAARYQLPPALRAELEQAGLDPPARQAAQATLDAIEAERQLSPAVLIPIDASQRSPRDRLYPMSFEVPLQELDLLRLHDQALAALAAYQAGAGDRGALYAEFDRQQRLYLSTLAGFGAVLGRAKEIAGSGQGASSSAIKLLANMPAPLQRLLDGIPSRFEVLNDIIKGREVFSNVGAVAPASTLTRFITAKDDNEKKTLAWGVITDAAGVMRITLRDFRPHVGLLSAAGRRELAIRLAQDYLAAYARGLNNYIRDLQHLTQSSRETRVKPGGVG